MNPAENLVIFDYSGTLSLEAPLFGRPESLEAAFAESGLDALGVKTQDFFWQQIVAPTWPEGSTTGIGYRRAMARRITALGIAPGRSDAEVDRACARFVEAYLDGSPLEPHWRPLLEALTLRRGTTLVVATDHYAEMTETILRNFRAWAIPAAKAAAGIAPSGGPAPFYIANSADLGFSKAERRFWEALKLSLALEGVRAVTIVDDFGFNEQMTDLYAAEALVAARQSQTLAVLGEVFSAPVRAIPFLVRGRSRSEAVRQIAEACARIVGGEGEGGRDG